MEIRSIVWDTSKTYMKKSSVAGLNHGANSMSYMRSLYWLVVLSIGFDLTVVQLVNLGKDYGQAPVLIYVELEYKNALEFSAVTVCNLNREIEYTTHVTSSTWPSDNYWKKLALEIDYDISNINKDDDLRERIQANYLKADIYFMSLNVKTIEQKEKYNFEIFISALGGAMSLYFGFVLILFFELIELSFYILVNVWKYLTEPHEKRNLQQEKKSNVQIK